MAPIDILILSVLVIGVQSEECKFCHNLRIYCENLKCKVLFAIYVISHPLLKMYFPLQLPLPL